MTRRTKLPALALAVLLAVLAAAGAGLYLGSRDDSRGWVERLPALWLQMHGAIRHEVSTENNNPLAYWQAGPEEAKALPVILVHGAGGDAMTAWFRLMPALAGKRLVLAPQLPYADLAGSGSALENFFWEQNHIIRLMDRLDLEKVSLVGLSAGAWVAGLVAMNYPKRVDRLVLISPMGLETEAVLAPLLGAENPGKTFLENMFHSPPPLLPLFAESLARPVEDALRALSHGMDPAVLDAMDLSGRLHLIRCPTLVVSGAQDRIIPPSVPQALAQGIPGARRLVLPDCGHAVVWDRADLLEDAVGRFLDQGPGEAGQ